jgi:hypothetical protein
MSKVRQRLLQAPQKLNASMGGREKGNGWNGRGESCESAVVVMVTTTGTAGPPDVRFTEAGLTLHWAPVMVGAGLAKFIPGTQVSVAVPLKPEALRVRL